MTAHAYPLLIKQILDAPLAHAPGQRIIDAEGMQYDYRTFADRIGRAAGALRALGAGEGSVVAVLDWDSHRYLECFFAVPMIGATLHTVNIRLSPEQVLYTINHAGDDLILCHADFLPMLSGIAARIERPWRLVILGDEAAVPDTLPSEGGYEALLARADPVREFPDLDENTRATLFYTTGTTGDPKGVTYSHRQLVLHTLGVAAGLGPIPGGGLNRGDVYMPITPLFHVHGWGIPYVATLMGLKQVYPGRYDPARLLGLIAEHDVTFSHCVPTILSMLLDAPEAEGTELGRWKVVIGGSALPEGLARRALQRGIDVHAAYGMSETCPFLTVADMMASRDPDAPANLRTATGKPVPMVRIRVVDAEMNDVPPGGTATGEIVARAPWLTQAYLRNEAGTDDLWRGGWLHTGDVGFLDDQGTLRITDRLKDVIKSGGEWVSSLALESLASTVDGVSEVAAIGIADPTWGERPLLVVVVGGDPAGIRDRLHAAFGQAVARGALSKWAVPERIEFLDSLPKTSVGKLDKKALRRRFA
ncbi:MAG: fatty acid--CoA ligase [Rhodobacteraceae bacterium]|nr:fatty acid--CoA ligase [Paracoccaceae bacterium]